MPLENLQPEIERIELEGAYACERDLREAGALLEGID